VDVTESVSIVLEGQVLGEGRLAVAGAVVVSSAGGKAVTDADGGFHLEVQLAKRVDSVQITAVGSGNYANQVGSKLISAIDLYGVNQIDALQLSKSKDCSPHWLPTFGSVNGVDDLVFALTVFDDGGGGGPALYVAGRFSVAGGVVAANNIAKWDGTHWAALGSGTNNLVFSLIVFDDGMGPALYAGGWFTVPVHGPSGMSAGVGSPRRAATHAFSR
jgi:hypothetical protein